MSIDRRLLPPAFEDTLMLRRGDRVYIEGTFEEGIVKEVHTHNVIVRVLVTGGVDDRSYSHESLRFAPLMTEPSLLFAH
jgi:hypothetical protein